MLSIRYNCTMKMISLSNAYSISSYSFQFRLGSINVSSQSELTIIIPLTSKINYYCSKHEASEYWMVFHLQYSLYSIGYL